MRSFWDKKKRKWVSEEEYRASRSGPAGVQILEDIKPFVSPIDGSVIGGRRQKRDHMRAHGVVEHEDVGRPQERVSSNDVAQDVKRAFSEQGFGD